MTDRQESEQLLRRSEQRLRSMLDSMLEGCQIIGSDWRYLYVNDAVAAQGQTTKEALLGHTVMEMYPGIEKTELFSILRSCMRKQTSQRMQTEFVFRDGSQGWFELSIQPVPEGILILSTDITERKRADEKYRSLVDEVSDGLYVTDAQGILTFASAALARILGFEQPQDLIGLSFMDFVAPSALDDIRQRYSAVMHGAESGGKLEVEVLRKDGTKAYLEIKPGTITADGQHVGSRGLVSDVTERKRAEETQRLSEERFRKLFENATVGMYRTTPDGRILMANPAVAQMLGYASFEELARRDLKRDGHSRDGFLQRIEKDGEIRGLESNWKRKDGTNVFIRESAKAIRGADGETLYYEGTVEDITERKRAEEALRESQRLLAQTFASLTDAVFVIDAKTTQILDCNPAASKMFGYSRQEMVGQTTAFLHVSEAALKEFRGYLKAAVKEKGVLSALEYEMKRKDGVVFKTEHSVAPFEDDSGKQVGWVSLVHDITERKQAEALQEAVYRIAIAAEKTGSLPDLYPQIHEIISSVMPAENFYITLYDERQNKLQFPYFKDAVDEPYLGEIEPGKGLTAYVLRTGKSLLCTQAVHDALERQGAVKLLGVPSAIWLGVPLIIEGKTIGVMVVQHYTDPVAYGEREQHMLEYVSSQIAVAISRKQAQAEIKATEEEYRSLVQNVPDGVYRTTLDGKILAANPAFVKLLGFESEEELKDRSAYDVYIDPQDRSRFIDQIRQGVVRNMEVRMKRRDGQPVFCLDNSRPFRDENGTVLYIEGTLTDITERKRTEEALKRSEETFRLLTEKSLMGIYILQDSKLAYVNPAFANIFGYAAEDIMDMLSPKDLIHPDDVQAVRVRLQARLEGDTETSNTSYKVIRKDGSIIHTEFQGTLIQYQGKPAVLGTAMDITERKRAGALQEAVYRIATAAEGASSLDDLFPQIHEIVSSVMPAENLFIALYDEKRNSMSFPYFKDAVDEPYLGEVEPGKGLTAYVLRTGKSLLCTQAVHDELERQGAVKLLGVPSAIWLGVPLILEGKTIGAMVVQHYTDSAAYGEREQHMLEYVSSQIAVAISRRQAEDAVRRRADELAALQATVLEITASHDAPKVLRTIVERASHLLNADSGGLYLCDSELKQVRCVVSHNTAVDYTGTVLKYGEGAAGVVAETGKPLILDDYRAWHGRASVYEATQPFGPVISVPMLWKGQVTGVLHALRDLERPPFTQADLDLLALFANHAAIAVENARLFESLQLELTERKRAEAAVSQRARELETLYQTSLEINAQTGLDALLTAIVKRAAALLDVDGGGLYLVQPDGQTIKLVVGSDFLQQYVGVTLQLGEGVSGRVAQTGETMSVANYEEWDGRARPYDGLPLRRVLSIPLKVKGDVIGVLHMSDLTRAGAFSAPEIRLVELFADQAALAISNARLYRSAQDELARRMETEKHIVDELHFNQTILGASPLGIATYDNTGQCLIANAALAAITGTTQEQVLKQNFRQLDWWKAGGLLVAAEAALANGTTARLEVHTVSSPGKNSWLECRLTPFDLSGKPHLLAIFEDVTERKRAGALQEAAYRIAAAAERAGSLDDLFPQIHEIVSSVMPAENLFIALYDEKRNSVQFPYFSDAKDEAYLGEVEPGKGLTAYVLRTGKSLLCTQAVHDELERQGAVRLLGEPSAIWLGVPLIVEGKTIGAVVVQHYTDPAAYGEREQHMLEYVSSQIAVAISRKQAEEALRESEGKLRALFAAMTDVVIVYDADGRYMEIAPTKAASFRYPVSEMLGKSVSDLFPPEEARFFVDHIREALKTGPLSDVDYSLRFGEQVRWFSAAVSALSSNLVVWVAHDVTERKDRDQALRVAEEKYRGIYENAMVGILQSTPDGKFIAANPTGARQLGYESPEELIAAVNDIRHQIYVEPGRRQEFTKLMEKDGAVVGFEYEVYRKDGSTIWVLENSRTVRDAQGTVLWYENLMQDITERRRAEQALRAAEEKYRGIFENAMEGILQTTPDGKIIAANPAGARQLGYASPEELIAGINDIGRQIYVQPDRRDEFKKMMERDGAVVRFESEVYRKDGTTIWVSENSRAVRDAQGTVRWYEDLVQDVTERRRAEQALRDSEAVYHNLFENTEVGMFRTRLDGSEILNANDKWLEIFGRTREEVIGKPSIMHWADPQQREEMMRRLTAEGRVVDFECRMLNKKGEVRDCITSLTLYPELGVLDGSVTDITERKRAEARVQRQFEHLTAISEIDRMIASSLDLRFSLSALLTHVTKQLGVDAADVLLLDRSTQMLEFAAGSGFHSLALQHTRLPLGQGYAGTAGQEQRLVHVSGLRTRDTDFLRSPDFKSEDFDTYIGVPLIAKGELVGVLEVFQRSPLEPDPEWFDFLSTLGGQAAIAIDSARLFENLQRSNFSLVLAYDATIEGWSRALDLRDRETEGHTVRVTDMCINLARLFGLQDEELVHMRRGALLHDIGKMGIPDSILYEPGPLTDEEWLVMKKHPTLAFEMLSPIWYLHAALDIPYCHHEKWDGSGYPRGLKGEQIPLAARIFAVVDVWDALTSDRPYRKAWTHERAVEYIRLQAGTHFDPQVVKVFLESDLLQRSEARARADGIGEGEG